MLRLDGEALDPEPTSVLVDGGYRIEVEVPAGPHALTVESGPEVSRAGWALQITDTHRDPVLEEIFSALPERADPAANAVYQTALAKLELASQQLSGASRVQALALRQKVLHATGQIEASLAVGTRTVEAALASGRFTDALRSAQVMTPMLEVIDPDVRGRHYLELQRQYLGMVVDETRTLQWILSRGSSAIRTRADLDSAIEALGQGGKTASRLGLDDHYMHLTAARVEALAITGRIEEAIASVDELLAHVDRGRHGNPCNVANDLNNGAWGLMRGVASDALLDRSIALTDRAASIFVSACGDSRDSLIARGYVETRLNGFLARVARGKTEDAHAAQRALSELNLDDYQSAWAELGRARLEALELEFEPALARLSALLPRESVVGDPLLAVEVYAQLGAVHTKLGHRRAALAAYAQADRRVEQAGSLTKLDRGRDGVLVGLHGPASASIAILLADDNVGEAFDLARRSRARAYQGWVGRAALRGAPVELRTQWANHVQTYEQEARRLGALIKEERLATASELDALRKAQEKLRSSMREQLLARQAIVADRPVSDSDCDPASVHPGQGSAWLLTHPIPNGWAVFLATADGVTAITLDTALPWSDPVALGRQVLEPFAATIRALGRVEVSPMLDFAPVDFHRLSLGDGVLLDAAAVAYRLGICIGDPARPPSDRTALVVDASNVAAGQLVESKHEAQSVAAALHSSGWAVARLSGSDASRDALVQGLANASWFHYAGHAEVAGSHGVESALVTSDNVPLTARDILAQATVPETVVMTACRSSVMSERSMAGGMHLAAAFIANGARQVVAATDDVDDRVAARLGFSVYQGGLDAVPDLAVELRRAQLGLRDRGIDGWTTFRAWVP